MASGSWFAQFCFSLPLPRRCQRITFYVHARNFDVRTQLSCTECNQCRVCFVFLVTIWIVQQVFFGYSSIADTAAHTHRLPWAKYITLQHMIAVTLTCTTHIPLNRIEQLNAISGTYLFLSCSKLVCSCFNFLRFVIAYISTHDCCLPLSCSILLFLSVLLLPPPPPFVFLSLSLLLKQSITFYMCSSSLLFENYFCSRISLWFLCDGLLIYF